MYRILFGHKADWSRTIERLLDRTMYAPEFRDFRSGAGPLEKYDCVVPFLEDDYVPLWARPAGSRRNFLIPDRAAAAIAGDKLATVSFFSARGYGCHFPEIYESAAGYPFVYKKRTGGFGGQVEIIFSAAQQQAFESRNDRSCCFKQRYVEGTREYTAHFVALRGEVVFSKCYWFDFGDRYFVKGSGSAHSATGESATPVPIMFPDMLKKLGYTGTCCFNYKIEAGQPLIFEINPRFGGSLCRDINAYLAAYLLALERMRRQSAPVPA
ncbi:MAG TPA: ATP-grasp domain-containing protein [Rhizomicrobium sp.]|nr:ATP-grasp domain-containing protein [Rhizomicrobium sp.]